MLYHVQHSGESESTVLDVPLVSCMTSSASVYVDVKGRSNLMCPDFTNDSDSEVQQNAEDTKEVDEKTEAKEADSEKRLIQEEQTEQVETEST